MKAEVCICVPAGDQFIAHAFRFLNSYLSFPGMCEHELILLTDPGNEHEAENLFSAAANVRAMATPDFAKDLSRYEFHCKQSSADFVMYLAGTSYCRRPGWLLKAITSFQRLGNNNQYGACGHTGAGPVRPHLRSTGIFGSPALFRRYPRWPKDISGRYPCEHGPGCISDWVVQQGGTNWVVSFNGEWPLSRANDDATGYARGNQQSLIIGDALTAPPYQSFA